jgi:hypothetical protein
MGSVSHWTKFRYYNIIDSITKLEAWATFKSNIIELLNTTKSNSRIEYEGWSKVEAIVSA